MIRRIPANRRHSSDNGWLKTYWLFSFAEYYDPENIRWGPLRVFNDDTVRPGKGFPTHPHSEMEIVSMVISGELTHADSMGNSGVLKAGEVQRMTAGTGLTHSEYNRTGEPLHFYQIWIRPGVKGQAPSYDTRVFSPEEWEGVLRPVASGSSIPGAVTLNTDATIYRASLDPGVSLKHSTGPQRKAFIYLSEGSLEVNGVKLGPGDQARVESEPTLEVRGVERAGLVLIDLPA